MTFSLGISSKWEVKLKDLVCKANRHNTAVRLLMTLLWKQANNGFSWTLAVLNEHFTHERMANVAKYEWKASRKVVVVEKVGDGGGTVIMISFAYP